MTTVPKYVLFVHSLFEQISMGEESLIAAARLFSDYHERVLAISIAPFNPTVRRGMLNDAGEELMHALHNLCSTEEALSRQSDQAAPIPVPDTPTQ